MTKRTEVYRCSVCGAVEVSSYDADVVAVHLWRHLVEAVVEHGLCLLHGLHELCHFGVWHGHGFKLLAAFEVAIL